MCVCFCVFSRCSTHCVYVSQACAATANELVCEGGEAAFISQMVQDSVKLQTQVRWYTSMCGRKETLKQVMGVLRSVNVRR
jgi:23S rRNA A1618 N6-methylase RlmF